MSFEYNSLKKMLLNFQTHFPLQEPNGGWEEHALTLAVFQRNYSTMPHFSENLCMMLNTMDGRFQMILVYHGETLQLFYDQVILMYFFDELAQQTCSLPTLNNLLDT